MVMAALMCFFCDGLAGALCHGDGACLHVNVKSQNTSCLMSDCEECGEESVISE